MDINNKGDQVYYINGSIVAPKTVTKDVNCKAEDIKAIADLEEVKAQTNGK